MSVVQLFHAAKAASSALARANTNLKNSALEQIALELENNIPHILAANALDLKSAQENGVSVGLQDRLKLDANRIGSLAAALRLVISLPDPIGQNLEKNSRSPALFALKVVGLREEGKEKVCLYPRFIRLLRYLNKSINGMTISCLESTAK